MAKVMSILTVSIDGATKKTFESFRIGADFDVVIANVRAFNVCREQLPPAERPKLQFNTILARRTIEELPRFIELAAELGVFRVVGTHLVVQYEPMRGESLDGYRELTNRCLAEAQEKAAELGVELIMPPPYPASGEQPVAATDSRPELCYFLWKRTFISPHGEVGPCCLSGIHSNGPLNDHTFLEIWNGPLYREMRRRVHTDDPYEPCKGCYLINRRTDRGKFDLVEQIANGGTPQRR
jgi:MoaA/NifB/PqqE/SkfB family radical SAM enzyme